jgi:hypothetical protein
VAATEFAVCLPFMFLILAGLWEVGRMLEIQGVTANAAREAARDASLSTYNLNAIASRTLVYLQAAEPQAFGQGHTINIVAPTVTLPANATGWTCFDQTANQELFTIYYIDFTNTTSTDPTTAAKLDHYQIGIQVPYATISMSPLSQITGANRLNTTADWLSMRDTPFQVNPVLPAQ